MGSIFFAAALLFLEQPAVVGPPVPVPAPARRPQGEDCPTEPSPDGEMVVCGDRYDENSPYRVPMQFRNQRSDDDRDASWTARINDEEAMARFGDQTVGPFGYLQRGRQRDCEWRAARQERQGRRPDCGARNRPDSGDDWRRRSGR